MGKPRVLSGHVLHMPGGYYRYLLRECTWRKSVLLKHLSVTSRRSLSQWFLISMLVHWALHWFPSSSARNQRSSACGFYPHSPWLSENRAGSPGFQALWRKPLGQHILQQCWADSTRISFRNSVNKTATYAEQTSPEAIKPNSVVSASVGASPPNTKNSSSESLDLRLWFDDIKRAFTFCQTSFLNLEISSAVNRPVPTPQSVAFTLR